MNPAVGLDIGNSKCVVAVSTDGVVDAVLNEESKRETPAVVHFANKHRLFGTAATSCATAYPASTISQIKRLVWLSFEEDKQQNERLLLPYETVESDSKRVSVKVRYLNEDRMFTAVEMLAMLFAQLKRTAAQHAKDSPMPNCVIGVPSYFSDEQKDAYRHAALIAGWNPLGLLHEGVATALEYAADRSDDDAQSVVAFVDIGHCDTQITVVRFRREEMTVLGEVWNSDLGGRDFDEVVFEHFMGVFEKQYGRDIRSNVKACVRLRTACEKAKRVLSANKEADVSIDYLMEGVEYASGVITRDKFEELSQGLLRRIGVVFGKALERFHVDVNRRIDSVELVGSGSRIPAISRILTRLFERDLSRTLNGSECVARGCALLCEILTTSPEDPSTKELIRRMGKRVALYNSTKTNTNFLSKSTSQETDLQNQDRSHERAKNKRNDLESYIYEVRKERNARTTTEAHEEKISEKLKEIEEWLYGEGDNESEDVYVKKLKHLKSFIHRPPVLVDVPSQQAAVHSRKNSASDLKRGESSRRKSLKTEDMHSEIGIVEENNSKPSGRRASSAYTKPASPRKKTSNEKESRYVSEELARWTGTSLNRTVTEPSNSEQESLNNIKDAKPECSMPQTKDLSEGADDTMNHTDNEGMKATKKTSICWKLPSWKPAHPSKINSNEEESRPRVLKCKIRFSPWMSCKNGQDRQGKRHREHSPRKSARQDERTSSNTSVTEPSDSKESGLNNDKDTKTENSISQTNDLPEYAGDPKTHTVKGKKLHNQDTSQERAKDKRNGFESHVDEARKERNARSTTEAHVEKNSKMLKEIKEWLYEEGDESDVYIERLEMLKSFIRGLEVQDTVDVPSQQAPVHSRKKWASDLIRGKSSRKKSLKTEGMHSEIGMVEKNNSKPSGRRASPTCTNHARPSKITSNEKESRSHAHKNKCITRCSLRMLWKSLGDRLQKVCRRRSPRNSAQQDRRTSTNTTVTEPSNSEREGLNNDKDAKTENSVPQTNDLSEDADDSNTHTVKESCTDHQSREQASTIPSSESRGSITMKEIMASFPAC